MPTPNHLDDIPACTSKITFELLNDFAVAAHGAIQTLQVAIDDKDQIVEFFPASEGESAERFWFIALTIAQECPDFAVAHFDQVTGIEILHDVGLVDGLQRPEPHGHRGKLPIVRHQPRVWIGRQSLGAGFTTKVIHLRLADAAFQKRSRVNTRGSMALKVDQIARA